jgi:sulfhydrogenase subunit beta (sulfur reductase)
MQEHRRRATEPAGLDQLIQDLRTGGARTVGPVVRDGAIVPGEISGVADLPSGYHDEQAPGSFRLSQDDGDEVFGWAVDPGSWKAELLPPKQVLLGPWHSRVWRDARWRIAP